MKQSLIILALLLTFNIAKGQINIGLEGGLNLEYYLDSDLGCNINGSVNYMIENKLGIGISSGFYQLKVNDISSERKLNIIPILFSSDIICLQKKIKPYLGIDFGSFIFREKVHLFSSYSVIEPTDHTWIDTKLHFGLAPKTGLQYSITKKVTLDFNAKIIYVFRDMGYVDLNTNLGIRYFLK